MLRLTDLCFKAAGAEVDSSDNIRDLNMCCLLCRNVWGWLCSVWGSLPWRGHLYEVGSQVVGGLDLGFDVQEVPLQRGR